MLVAGWLVWAPESHWDLSELAGEGQRELQKNFRKSQGSGFLRGRKPSFLEERRRFREGRGTIYLMEVEVLGTK